MTKKDRVDIMRISLDTRHEETRHRTQDLLTHLDGTRAARVALLAGLSREQLDAVGGVGEAGLARGEPT